MKYTLLYLLFTLNYSLCAHASSEMNTVSKDLKEIKAAPSTENYIKLSREKLGLEMELRKVRELLKSSEERIKELVQNNQEMEKEIASLEKELSKSEKNRDELEEQNTQLLKAMGKIQSTLRETFPTPAN